MSITRKPFRPVWLLLTLTLISSCAREPMVQETGSSEVSADPAVSLTSPQPPGQSGVRDRGRSTTAKPRQQAATKPKSYVSKGSGVFLNPSQGSQARVRGDGDVTLNFEAADLHEIIKVVFEEILEANYLIDPRVQGVATIHTTRSIPKENVLVVLESVLQTNGAALIKEADLYKVVPIEDAKKEITIPTVGSYQGTQSTGFGTHVVPLKFVSAMEMKKLLESVSKESATSVQVDATRNILILSGTRGRISNLMETIRIFDVDWLKGMSFALFPLQYADPKILSDELTKMLGGESAGPLAGIVQLLPMERLNSIMVITHRPQYLDEARKLIEQFDRGTDTGSGRRLYVYHLKNGKADNIATLLQDIFGQPPNNVPPPSSPRSIGNVRPASATTTASTGFPAAPAASAEPATSASSASIAPAAPAAPAPSALQASTGGASEGQGINTGEITIIADQTINAILVLSTPQDYRVVESAIRQLDTAPHQVMIEATIAEVQLTDNLSYGVRWFFNDNIGSDRVQGGFGEFVSGAGGSNNFSIGIFDSLDQMKIFFDILETETNVKFLSAPQVMVLDNQTANIRVGDQIPIVTRSSQGISDSNAPIVSEVQYRDTGTLLSVTPRVNTGGLVTLEISQEVSVPGTAGEGSSNVPISQRTIDSTVMIQSGQTVVLGGLIRETTTRGNGGIPGFKNIPVLGVLFGSTTQDASRTELIVTITPRVVTNPMEAREITEEFRKRVKAATDMELSIQH